MNLPPLKQLRSPERRKLLAVLRGRRRRTLSPEQREALEEAAEEARQTLAQLRADHPNDKDFKAAVQQWRQIQRDLRFLQRVAKIGEQQRREREIDAIIETAIRDGVDSPRRLATELAEFNLTGPNINYRLRVMRDDLTLEARGIKSPRQLAAEERAAELRDIVAACAHCSRAEMGAEP